jgi:8-oxo-dGTP diphosphatase
MNKTNGIVCDTQAVAVDVVIFTVIESDLKVLLIQRVIKPVDAWAIPGGFVLKDEDLKTAAKRELLEETGVKDVYLEQLYSFGDPKRDPRARVISVAYFALVEPEKVELRFGSDAKDVAWFSMKDIPPLAFDHKEILDYAYQRLIWKLEYTNVVYSLLPRFFTLTQLQQAYETILDHPLDKRNFRRKFIHTGLIVPTGEKEGGAHRPAELYRFVKEKPAFIQNPFGQFLKK